MNIKDLWPSDLSKIGEWERAWEMPDLLTVKQAACFLADYHPALTPSKATENQIRGLESSINQDIERLNDGFYLCGYRGMERSWHNQKVLVFPKYAYQRWHNKSRQGVNCFKDFDGERSADCLTEEAKRIYSLRKSFTVFEFACLLAGLDPVKCNAEYPPDQVLQYMELIKEQVDEFLDIPF